MQWFNKKQFCQLAHISLIIWHVTHFATTAKLSNWVGSNDRVPMATQPFLGVRTTAFSHSWYPFSCPDAYWPYRREKEFSDEEMPTPSSFICYQASQRFSYRGNTTTLPEKKEGQGIAIRDMLSKRNYPETKSSCSSQVFTPSPGLISEKCEKKRTFATIKQVSREEKQQCSRWPIYWQ